jgi:hypothetical protein
VEQVGPHEFTVNGTAIDEGDWSIGYERARWVEGEKIAAHAACLERLAQALIPPATRWMIHHRGAQMINVVLGADLDQDAYGRTGSRRYNTILPRKVVQIMPETRLAQIADATAMQRGQISAMDRETRAV